MRILLILLTHTTNAYETLTHNTIKIRYHYQKKIGGHNYDSYNVENSIPHTMGVLRCIYEQYPPP